MKNLLIAAQVTVVLTLAGCQPTAPTGAEAESAPPGAPPAPTAVDNPTAAGSTVPNVAAGADGSLLMSWLEPGDERTLRVARFAPSTAAWTEPEAVYSASGLFANWADFPSVIETADGSLVTHWLEYLAEGRYAYGVKLSRRGPDGNWSEPWQPHEDSSPVEHGFVSLVPGNDGGYTAMWLDGRAFADGTNEMSVRARTYQPDGSAGPEEALDLRACDCCQTGAAYIGDNLVLAYRDRSPEEVRDIWTVRRTAAGWTEPQPVAEDGWMIPGCPVNGPVVTSVGGNSGAVIWFALVDEAPEVKLAFTHDGGATFETPILIERGNAEAQTLGRVDLAATADGLLLATWLSQVGDQGEIRYRTIAADGALGATQVLAATGADRGSGFPRVEIAGETVLFAWTDTLGEQPAVHTATLPVGQLPRPQ